MQTAQIPIQVNERKNNFKFGMGSNANRACLRHYEKVCKYMQRAARKLTIHSYDYMRKYIKFCILYGGTI